MKKIPIYKLLVIVALLVAAGYAAWTFFAPHPPRVPYKTFYAQVEKDAVRSADIAPDFITFTGTDGKKAVTENPQSPSLEEFLLLHGAEVQVQKGADEIISIALDSLFYIIFFVVIFTVFKKFVSPNTFRVVHHTGVTFADVVGMDGLKRDMIQVVDIMKHPEIYKGRGIRMPKGILLEGAPGNGKTLFARALAGEAKVNFIPAKATDFESMFMAIGPAKVKLLFSKARRRAPCIVFIDEFDGIGTRRNYSGSAIETENTRIVTALLNELDGFTQNSGILVLAATNSRKALDEALIRPGRFDAKYSIPYPDAEERVKLVNQYIRGKKIVPDCSVALLSKMFNGFSCAQIESVLNRAALIAGQQQRAAFTMDDIKAALKEL